MDGDNERQGRPSRAGIPLKGYLRRPRPGPIVFPKTTEWRLRRRNANGVPQDVNGQELDRLANNPLPHNRAEELARNNQDIEEHILGPGDENPGEAQGEVDEVEAGEGRQENGNEMFAAALLEDRPLTVGPKNIERNPYYEENISPTINTTRFETLLLILKFSMRHGLTSVATEDLCKMINVIMGSDVIPTTKHKFAGLFAGDLEVKYHMFCPPCMVYLGVITPAMRERKTERCPTCRKEVKVPGLNGKDFFATLPVGSQIADMLQTMDNVLDNLNHRWEREPSENIRDVYDGQVYKELNEEGNFLSHKYNLSLTVSTDGASVFESGCTTMWPIFFRINELKPEMRFDDSYNMLAGLWFSEKEPEMSFYFKAFLHESRTLYHEGIYWKVGDEVINSKIIVLNCVLDSGAKYMLQGTKKFNGYQSCPYCDHPGTMYGNNHVCKWPMSGGHAICHDMSLAYNIRVMEGEAVVRYNVSDRSNDSMRNDMDIAEQLRTQQANFVGYKGIKGTSAMCYLPYFDVCFGFQIDYLHAVLLGTCVHLAELWFDSTREPPYHIANIDLVNERLVGIQPPSSISRRPRSILQKSDWHGNEWRSWLLYYSLPCLKGILSSEHFKHHCILVSAVHTLLKTNITNEEINSVMKNLAQYVSDFQNLYSHSDMYFNVHLLLHLPKSVLLWGPLWCYSMFSFESSNHTLMKYVKGSTGVASQIVSKYKVCKYLPNLMETYAVSPKVVDYCDGILAYKQFSLFTRCGNVIATGKSHRELSHEERIVLSESDFPLDGNFYERMMIGKIKYHSKWYSVPVNKSNDTIARLQNGTYVEIQRILKVREEDEEIFVLMRKINTTPGYITLHQATGAKAKHIKVCRPFLYGNLFLKNAGEIVGKSILLDCGQHVYVTDFPNTIEKD